MEQLHQSLKPLIDQLPEGIRDYWMFMVVGMGLLVLVVVLVLLRAMGRALFGKRQEMATETDREWVENLAALPPGPTGKQRLTIYHIPVRLRLVVVAPAGKDAQVDATAVERLLERAVPGLGGVAQHDRPRIRVWPAQLSNTGFASIFFRRTLVPDREGQPSRWVLLAGRPSGVSPPVLLGLALEAEKPNTLGRREVQPHQWVDMLRFKT